MLGSIGSECILHTVCLELCILYVDMYISVANWVQWDEICPSKFGYEDFRLMRRYLINIL